MDGLGQTLCRPFARSTPGGFLQITDLHSNYNLCCDSIQKKGVPVIVTTAAFLLLVLTQGSMVGEARESLREMRLGRLEEFIKKLEKVISSGDTSEFLKLTTVTCSPPSAQIKVMRELCSCGLRQV